MRRLLLLAVFLLPCALHAQSTEADIKARLLKKPLYLRSCWREDKLKFDGNGKLMGKPEVTTFTLAGIDVESVKMKPDRLLLSGHRVGVLIEKDAPKRMPLDERIQIEVVAPANQDYTGPLSEMFAENLAEMVPTLPSYWQPWAQQYILHLAPPSSPAKPAAATAGASRIGGSVKAPIPIKMPDPSFSKAAHDLRISGKILVYLWVDAQGKPAHLRLLHPRGLGLDELALAAVSAYEFKPATKDGNPVTVEMNVEINFDID